MFCFTVNRLRAKERAVNCALELLPNTFLLGTKEKLAMLVLHAARNEKAKELSS